jgi:hypothetical protein
MLTVESAQTLLPKIGDVRMERPTIDESTATRGTIQFTKPQRCVVVEVNTEHLWYTVQFENGFRESYKVPQVKQVGGDGYG